ncbi:hypothetical protein [Natronorubrum sp. DTA28]|uniref:hypothetical protein n=1 Tax=Natronorubrum sp. DTA28 TaxID=3447019 RepID=UPI003F833600
MSSPNEAPDRNQNLDQPSRFDERALYTVVRKAVRDALLDVIGTLVLLALGLASVWAGVQNAASQGADGLLFAVPMILLGVYCAAYALDFVPRALGPLSR